MTKLSEKDWKSFLEFLKEEKDKIYFLLYLLDFWYPKSFDPFSEEFKKEELEPNSVVDFVRHHEDLAEKATALTLEALNNKEGNPIHEQNKIIDDKIIEFYTRYEYQKEFLDEHPEKVKDLEQFGYNEKIKVEYKDLLEFFNVKINEDVYRPID